MSMAAIAGAVAPAYEGPGAGHAQTAELLCGMGVQVHEEVNGWCRVQGPAAMGGWLEQAALLCGPGAAERWQALGKRVVRSTWLDVLAAPEPGAVRIACLPRGALVHQLAQPAQGGWQPVALPDGREGFAKSGNLMPYIADGSTGEEGALREALAASALSYLGTQYRSGGNTPQGIDAAGLVAMAALLNGLEIPRSTQLAPAGRLRAIERPALAMGDVLYFGGHVGLYLGEDKFVHATAADGSDGVVINSLDAESPFYRADLAEGMTACASLFG